MIAALVTLDAGLAVIGIVVLVLIAVTAHDAIRPSPEDPDVVNERSRAHVATDHQERIQ